MKNLFIKILLSLVTGLFLIGGFNALPATEVDNGMVVVDRKPWKVSWIQQDEKTWVLLADFDKGELRTYFKQAPPKTGFGLDQSNKPIKQEFEFFGDQKFVSTTCQYEQWPDGAKAWAFKFDDKFKRGTQTYRFGTTAVIEEVGDAENEIRYALLKTFEIAVNEVSKDQSSEQHENDDRHLSELPEFEQFAVKSLQKKLDLLRVHQDYIFSQSDAVLRFMELLENEKDKDGNIRENRFTTLINTAKFPNMEIMKSKLEAISNDPYLGYKAKYCLELISINNKENVYKWFESLEKEILVDIKTYEDSGMNLPQYKYILEMYTNAKSSLKFQCQMMQLMSPKIFNN